jgi:hypothetical protein
MSLGNGNPKEGDKGSNFNYELKVLQGLEAIAISLENPPVKTFTSTAGTTNGAGVNISNSLLIPANTISDPGVIEILSKFYRISGTTAVISPFVYINTSNSLTGATLLATGGQITTVTQGIALARTSINYASGFLKVTNPSTLTSSDFSALTNTSIPFNPAVDNYFMFATGVTAGDTAVCQSYRVTIY